jgi:hypothetical protein
VTALLASPRELDTASDADGEVLRQLRNACRGGFAHNDSEISPERQASWLQQRRAAHDLIAIDYLVGFGTLTLRKDAWWTTVGVLPWHRGHNYGRSIVTNLVHLVRHRFPGCQVLGEALPNSVGAKTHDPALWALEGTTAEGLWRFRAR